MKTIEEAASIYAEPIASDLSHKSMDDLNICDLEDYIADSFKEGVEFAQRWIPVEEELPPLGVPVICKYSMFGKEYHWTGTFYTEVMHFVKKHLQITHWRLI
ncbi:MAG: hypothetical protein PHY47_22925 [Lachnospiraceae bacterium]|nr:hypothetical protein [Lachnospiraceae bacterium]